MVFVGESLGEGLAWDSQAAAGRSAGAAVPAGPDG